MMSVHVVFGTGPIGMHVAKALLEQGHRVRLVNRSGWIGKEAQLILPDVGGDQLEIQARNAMDAKQALEAAKGAQAIYHCMNPLYHQWKNILPTLQDNLVEAALALDVPLVVSENLYSYERGVEIISEQTPELPPTRKGAIRKVLHEELVRAGVHRGLKWVSIRGSDYYGPVSQGQSMFGTQYFLDPLFSGKAVTALGDPDQIHSYTYVGDFGRALALACQNPKSWGNAWIVCHREKTTTREIAQKFFEQSGKTQRISVIPGFFIQLAGLFNPVMRELPEMLYQKTEPYVVSGARFERQFSFTPTSLEQGIRETLEWYQKSSAMQQGPR